MKGRMRANRGGNIEKDRKRGTIGQKSERLKS